MVVVDAGASLHHKVRESRTEERAFQGIVEGGDVIYALQLIRKHTQHDSALVQEELVQRVLRI